MASWALALWQSGSCDETVSPKAWFQSLMILEVFCYNTQTSVSRKNKILKEQIDGVWASKFVHTKGVQLLY
jgi:hypothetical protein